MYPQKLDQEIEVKFCIRNTKAVEDKLIKMGAILVQPRTHEYNLRFDTPDRQLMRTRQVLRLRRDSRVRLTFKGQAEWQGRISARKEIEFSVGDFEAAKKFVQALGYEIILVYEKFRTTYLLNEFIITIDEMPYGLFLEIEGPNPNGIQEFAEKLELAWEARLGESYLMLFDRAKKAFNISFRDLSFENFKDLKIDLALLDVSPADE